MQIISPAFKNNGPIPGKYTCDAENISPELHFLDVPPAATSLTLICHDPDAPREGGWTHWGIINMDSTTLKLEENEKPHSGLETKTSYGEPGYKGPCPPSGTHRYIFYLYALDTLLDLDHSAEKNEVEEAMNGHILETATLTGLYQRKA